MINTFFLISDHAPFGFCSQNTCNIYAPLLRTLVAICHLATL